MFGEGGLVSGEDVRLAEFKVALDDLENRFESPGVEEVEQAIDDGEALFGDEGIDEGAGYHLRLRELGDGGVAEIGEAEGIQDDHDALGVFALEGAFCEAEGGGAAGENRVTAKMAVGGGLDGSGVGFCFARDDFEEVRLSAAGLAHDGDEFAGLDVEAEALCVGLELDAVEDGECDGWSLLFLGGD